MQYLYSADAAVKSLFELGNNPYVNTTRYHSEQLIKEVQRHPLDYGSMEAKCKLLEFGTSFV